MPYYDPYNPYPNPGYPYSPRPQPQTPALNQFAFVNGIEGAKSFPMQPNQTVLLMDSEHPIAYKKTSNGMGQATLEYFLLKSVSEADLRASMGSPAPSTEYVTRREFDELQRKLEELTRPVSKKTQKDGE